MRALLLVFWILVCQGVGLMGGRWTAPEIRGWYAGLRKPRFNPPGWVFGPVWTVLYLLMAIAAWRVSLTPTSELRTAGLVAFAVQLVLNLAWSWIFFRRHALWVALADLVLLWLAIGVTTLLFAPLDRTAAWMMTPYWAWTSFAGVLNASVARLNGRRAAST